MSLHSSSIFIQTVGRTCQNYQNRGNHVGSHELIHAFAVELFLKLSKTKRNLNDVRYSFSRGTRIWSSKL